MGLGSGREPKTFHHFWRPPQRQAGGFWGQEGTPNGAEADVSDLQSFLACLVP